MSELIVEVNGTYREQGRTHGEALAPIIREIIDEVVDADGWDESKLDDLFGKVEANLGRWAPGVLDEMQGIAEGSDIPYRDILTLNALADIWMVHKFCSSIGFGDSPDGPVIGKTNDIGKGKEKYHHPFRRRSGDGLPCVWATWPGTVWSNCFANAGGLAVGGASLTMQARNDEGVPSNCMYRVIMDQSSSVDEVLALCDRVPVMHHPSHNVVADDRGKLVAIELTPEGCRVCQGPDEPAVFATNHFCAGPWEGKDTSEPRHVLNSQRRLANFARLAETLPHTVDGMTQVITNHADEGQICQHGNEDMWSSTGYIAVPAQRRLIMGRGQPCEAEFFEVVL